MNSRNPLHKISMLLLAGFCFAAAGAQAPAPAGVEGGAPSPPVRMPAMPDTSSPQAVKQSPMKLKDGRWMTPTAASPAAVTVNPTLLYSAPFAHDYSEGGVYGDYGVYSVVFGDFRHAGTMDAVGLSIDGILTLMSNDGKGRFSKVSSVLWKTPDFVNVNRTYAFDLDGDGWLDVIALDVYQPGYIVWKNQRNGTFSDAVRTAVTLPAAPDAFAQPNGMGLGDLDGDGKADLVLAYTVATSADPSVQMFLAGLKGNGDGTFQAPVANAGLTLPSAASIRGIELADMQNSGALDVVASVVIADSRVGAYVAYPLALSTHSIRPGELAMPSQDRWIPGSYGRGGSFLVRDVDGDGNRDVMASPGQYDVYLAKGDGKGSLTAPRAVIHTDRINVGSTLGDFNGDGYLDAAVVSDGLTNIYNGIGGGAFTPGFTHQYPGAFATPPASAAVDLNGDGIDDFTQSDGFFNYLISYVNDGKGDFPSAVAIRPANVSATEPNNAESSVLFSVIGQGDYNNDGLLDVLAQEGSNFVDVGLNDGKGGLQFVRSISAATATSLRLDVIEPIQADFNGDGMQDVVFASRLGVVVGLSDGKGGFGKWVTTALPARLQCAPNVAAAGDLDGDGKLDIVLPYAGDDFCGSSQTVTGSGYFILKGDGTGAFTASFTAGGTQYYQAQLADMNQDGKLDILLNDIGRDVWNISLIAGDGTVAPAAPPVQMYALAALIRDFNINDVNGDGNLDLIVSQEGSSSATDNTRSGVVALLGKGDGTLSTEPVFLVDGAPAASVTIADINHDGHADVLATLQPTSKLLNGLAVIRGNGDGTFQSADIYPTPIEENRHFNRQVYAGPYQAAGSVDVLLGGGDEYVPSVLYQNAAVAGLQLSANRASSLLGEEVSLYAQMSTAFGNAATGVVSFLANGKAIGTGTIQNNLATFATSALAAGDNSVTASYAGDATHVPATSQPVVVTVRAPLPDFAFSADAASLSVLGGGTSKAMLSVRSNASTGGTLALSCIGLPATLACSFSPAASQVGPSQTVGVQLTVERTKFQALTQPKPAGAVPTVLAGLVSLAGIGCLRRRRYIVALCGVVLTMSLAMTGCGGSHQEVETANFTVVAQVTTNGVAVSHSVPMQVMVKQ